MHAPLHLLSRDLYGRVLIYSAAPAAAAAESCNLMCVSTMNKVNQYGDIFTIKVSPIQNKRNGSPLFINTYGAYCALLELLLELP